MESRHSVQSTSVSYGGIGEIQKDVPNSRLGVKRTTGYTYIDGHPGAGAEIESYCRIFGLEPELMLGM